MAEWEYRVINLPRSEESIQELLNGLGRDGWELVQVVSSVDLLPSAVLKREVPV